MWWTIHEGTHGGACSISVPRLSRTSPLSTWVALSLGTKCRLATSGLRSSSVPTRLSREDGVGTIAKGARPDAVGDESLRGLAENALDRVDGNPVDPGDLGGHQARMSAKCERGTDVIRSSELTRASSCSGRTGARQGSQNTRFPR